MARVVSGWAAMLRSELARRKRAASGAAPMTLRFLMMLEMSVEWVNCLPMAFDKVICEARSASSKLLMKPQEEQVGEDAGVLVGGRVDA